MERIIKVLVTFIVAGALALGADTVDARVITGSGYQDKIVEHGEEAPIYAA